MPSEYVLTESTRQIVEMVCANPTPDLVAEIRKIHEDRLAELRPQLAAMQREVAMRELALEILPEADHAG